jgi:hypothetical protein
MAAKWAVNFPWHEPDYLVMEFVWKMLDRGWWRRWTPACQHSLRKFVQQYFAVFLLGQRCGTNRTLARTRERERANAVRRQREAAPTDPAVLAEPPTDATIVKLMHRVDTTYAEVVQTMREVGPNPKAVAGAMGVTPGYVRACLRAIRREAEETGINVRVGA